MGVRNVGDRKLPGAQPVEDAAKVIVDVIMRSISATTSPPWPVKVASYASAGAEGSSPRRSVATFCIASTTCRNFRQPDVASGRGKAKSPEGRPQGLDAPGRLRMMKGLRAPSHRELATLGPMTSLDGAKQHGPRWSTVGMRRRGIASTFAERDTSLALSCTESSELYGVQESQRLVSEANLCVSRGAGHESRTRDLRLGKRYRNSARWRRKTRFINHGESADRRESRAIHHAPW